MALIDLEEKNLKKRLEELEKRYNENSFKEPEMPLPELPGGTSYEKPERYKPLENESEPLKDSEQTEDESEFLKDSEQTENEFKSLKDSEQTENESEPLEDFEQIKNEIKPPEPPKKMFTGIFKKLKVAEEPLFAAEKVIKPSDKKKVQMNFKAPLENRELSGKINPLEIKKTAEKIQDLKKEISKVLVGQEEIVEGLIRGLLCNSHVLLEGVPGIAKTLAIRALASASGCSVKRIQFTVDMLPTDIIGITSYTPEKGFEVIKGPIFANFLIADEINRAPPKTQSALIEGMQEKQVTIGKESFILPDPFFVMATENPIENAGVYPLPEAQVDRFLFKLIMGYPEPEEEKEIMDTNITIKKFEQFNLKPVVNPTEIINMQELVKKVYIDDNVKNYILSIIRKTREKDFENAQYISYGCSPRASIGLFIASKANALMEGRDYVLPEDVKKIVFDVMRHRLILSYKASIQKISSDLIIKEILNSISIE